MNKLNKKLLILTLILTIGGSFAIYSVQAQNNELILEAAKECNIQYTGDSCVAELKLSNNTSEILDGEASLHIDYRGVCGDGPFDGEGIKAQFSINNDNWLNFSDWEEGTTKVSGFEITKGETQPKLKIETVSNLCPGEYIFIFTLKGTKAGEEYPTSPIIIGGGGGGGGSGFFIPKLEIRDENILEIEENQVTITWLTTKSATSRVIYSSENEHHILEMDNQPNYGYVHSTEENAALVISHSVVISGLDPGTTYYYRCVSHSSFAVSTEYSFTTLSVIGEEEEEEPAEEFEEVRPLENSDDEEVVRGRTSTEAEEELAIESEEPAFAEASVGEEEEEIIEGEEAGLGWLLAAIGDLFRLENLWWFLLLLIIIIIILFLLSCKKKRKEE